MKFLPSYNEVEPPESFVVWRDSTVPDYDEEDELFGPETKYFNNVSEVYEYYSKIIPKNIWKEFSLYLAKVIDYYKSKSKPFEGRVL
jgi:hypothetical protein